MTDYVAGQKIKVLEAGIGGVEEMTKGEEAVVVSAVSAHEDLEDHYVVEMVTGTHAGTEFIAKVSEIEPLEDEEPAEEPADEEEE